jgi:hypothetical protein
MAYTRTLLVTSRHVEVVGDHNARRSVAARAKARTSVKLNRNVLAAYFGCARRGVNLSALRFAIQGAP